MEYQTRVNLLYKLRLLIDYLETNHSYLQKENANLEEKYQRDLAELENRTPKEIEDEADFFGDQDAQMENYYCELQSELNSYSQISYSSFLISIYSIIEKQFISFCKDKNLEAPKNDSFYLAIVKKFLSFFTHKKLGKTNDGFFYLHTAKDILAGAGYRVDKNMWEELLLIKEIRNRFVHSEDYYYGRPNKPKNIKQPRTINIENRPVYFEMTTRFYSYLNTNNIVQLRGMSLELDITAEYCEHLIIFADALLKDMAQKTSITIH